MTVLAEELTLRFKSIHDTNCSYLEYYIYHAYYWNIYSYWFIDTIKIVTFFVMMSDINVKHDKNLKHEVNVCKSKALNVYLQSCLNFPIKLREPIVLSTCIFQNVI